MRPLIIIPARKGSKGVPGKNKKILNGKPLIQYTIEAALIHFNTNDICISTDDEDIIKISEELGLTVPFVRPSYLSNDTATSQDVLIHALQNFDDYSFDCIILLQPTSPFRNGDQIKEAFELFKKTKELDMIVSVCEPKSNPYFNLFEEDHNKFLTKSKISKATRRQDIPKVYEFNGAIYCINKSSLLSKPMQEFKKVQKYLMDEFTSHDIDTLYDWKLAELLLKKDD